MRSLFLLAILIACVLICEGRHRKRDELKQMKKKHRELGVPYSHHGTSKGHHKKHRDSRLRGKHLDLDHFKSFDIKSIRDDEWMKFPKKSKECKTIKCPPKHYCLTVPSSQKERCVSYKNFREGRRLFRSYHRQKMLLEKNGRLAENKYETKEKAPSPRGKLSDPALEEKLQKAEKMKDVYSLVKDYKKSFNHHNHKDIDIKSIAEAVEHKNVKEADPATLQECRPNEVYQLRKRLVGWFVLLHTESRQHHHRAAHHKHRAHDLDLDDKPFKVDKLEKFGKGLGTFGVAMHNKFDKHHDKFDKHHGKFDKHSRSRRSTHSEIDVEIHGHCKCSKSVMWEFRSMDKSGDGHLTHEELASIESIQREPCLKPLVKSCDKDGDGKLTRGEWCCCMRDTVPPCAEKKRLSDNADWEPKCDAEGYFQREQCHKSGHCWCVDIDGNSIPDTKTMGSAHCGKYDPNGKLIKM